MFFSANRLEVPPWHWHEMSTCLARESLLPWFLLMLFPALQAVNSAISRYECLQSLCLPRQITLPLSHVCPFKCWHIDILLHSTPHCQTIHDWLSSSGFLTSWVTLSSYLLRTVYPLLWNILRFDIIRKKFDIFLKTPSPTYPLKRLVPLPRIL